MRYRKKELYERLEILNQVNRKFKTSDRGKIFPVQDELAKCQNIALEIGTCLETLEEVTKTAVKLLEDYCECLYQQSIHLYDLQTCRRISRKVQKQLDQITRIIKFELPEEKREVVFLPYKASMWDSLESVWMAAKEDEGSEVHVVPIPYFDKNPDGSLGRMYDEKDEYPDYVTVTDWREYDMTERQPDVVFIHNPYDECNYVTTVHPAFYARELKKYVDTLVYIPYFVGINDRVEDHFCVLPGVLYANRVIVESEAVKKQYIDALHKFEKENHCKGQLGDWDKKILALGSPKLDRVRKINRESIVITENWKGQLKKADGTRRKIVLYNTTVASLLRYGETALQKLEHTLQVFRNDPDVVLLWRPHPLLLSTIHSMRENLYSRYCRIIEDYQREGWGIYDDTADPDRAIVLSDAYYGDWSSMVTLYRATGKPVMIQNYEIETEINLN